MAGVILAGDYVLTMDPGNRVVAGGAVAVEGDRIVAVGALDEVVRDRPGWVVRPGRNRLLMPGLVNAHMHSGMLRGTAEGLPVWDWLRMYIDPMHRVLTAGEAEASSWLCYAEAALSGTTTVVDMWRFMAGSARAASAIGIRLNAVPYVGEHPDYDYFDTLDDNEALLEAWHGKADGRVRVWVGVEHAFYATPPAHRRAIAMAQKWRTGFHTHSNEADVEIAEMARRYGKRPIAALEEMGLLEAPHTLLAHCVWLDDAEIDVLARRGVSVAHNPTSNMKLASGAAPVRKFRAAGIAVGIGTDGEKENNNLDMFEELKFASLLTKFASNDAAALDSWDVLRMATIDGARAIGMADEIGSLEVGKKADIVTVRTDTPRMTPLVAGFLQHNLVHAVQGGDVDVVMVNGAVIVESGVLKTADAQALMGAVNEAAPKLLRRRDAWLEKNRDGAVTPISRAV
jgi:5-methylthioadenosine/S-adenosylhomocysteine deaminase